MSYKQKHTEILDSETGYNLVATQYKNYHKHLDSFYDLDIQRFLPRDNQDLDIIDLGAGDGRLFKYFENVPFRKYTACDIAPELLAHHPERGIKIEKVVCDLETTLPFDEDSFDIAMSFFVLEHISDLQSMFEETYRILKNGGKFIIGHFLQRREFEWSIGKGDKHKKFKIKQYHYRLEEIQEAAEYSFFKFEYQEIVEEGVLIGYLIICDKD
ncbi:MAG TPA: class I SAM-dependent methyltransferase [Candidatus Absconditabacterales bacterium]|nr:class I SAM-dependent methyltransferase [Candidatus Absconditabacterales bacterium]